MAYDRYDSRHGPRDHARHPDDRYRDREGGGRGGSEERGFFERAGEQIASWFGDEDDDDRGQRDRMGSRERERGNRDEGGWRGSPQPQGWGSRTPSDRDYRGDRSERGSYRPVTGDYGRSEGMQGGQGRGGSSDWESGKANRPDSNWGGGDQPPAEFARSTERQHSHDPHYQQWRQQQIDQLDRDYDEYRREHQSKFENDFGSWRSNRQTKRQMVGQVRGQMQVLGSDGELVGTVDRVAGDRIILSRSDETDGGMQQSLGCTDVDRIEGDQVFLSSSAEQARNRWRDDRNRAPWGGEGGRENQSGDGPHILDRSFSGTYR